MLCVIVKIEDASDPSDDEQLSAEDDDGNALGPMSAEKRKWPQYPKDLRMQLGDTMGTFQPWTQTGALCVGVSTPRAKDVVNVGWLHRTRQAYINFIKERDAIQKQNAARQNIFLYVASSSVPALPQAPTRQELMENFVARPYQSVKMLPWSRRFGTQTRVTCLTTRDLVYSYKHDCVLPPRGHLYIQGFPRNVNTDGMRDADIKKLAGNSFNWIPLAAVCYAMMTDEDAPWWQHDPGFA